MSSKPPNLGTGIYFSMHEAVRVQGVSGAALEVGGQKVLPGTTSEDATAGAGAGAGAGALYEDEGLRHVDEEGNGLIATAPIKAGEVVWVWSRREVVTRSRTQILAMEDPEEREAFIQYSWQVGEELHEGPRVRGNETVQDAADRDAMSYINHSCDPTVWFDSKDSRKMTARRDIAVGEQITYDYATSEAFFVAFNAKCLCGSEICRGHVSPDDWKRADLQKRYDGHFKPFLQARINKERAAAAAATADKVATGDHDAAVVAVLGA